MRVALGWMAVASALLIVPIAASRMDVVLAVLSAVILGLALFRTVGIALRAVPDRRPRSDRLFVAFLASLGVASAIVIGPIAAYGATTLVFWSAREPDRCGYEGPEFHVALMGLVAAFVAGVSLKRWLWTPRGLGASHGGAAEPASSRGAAPRLSLVGAMKMIAILTVCLAILHALKRQADRDFYSSPWGDMYDFCVAEAALFDARSRDCRSRSADDVPWDDPAEHSRFLRTGPYPWDRSINRSWGEQSQVWKRAADQARKMAQWYGSH